VRITRISSTSCVPRRVNVEVEVEPSEVKAVAVERNADRPTVELRRRAVRAVAVANEARRIVQRGMPNR